MFGFSFGYRFFQTSLKSGNLIVKYTSTVPQLVINLDEFFKGIDLPLKHAVTYSPNFTIKLKRF